MDSFTVARNCTVDRANRLNKLVTNIIVKDLRPISFVDGSAFRELMDFVEPGYNMPHRTYFTGQIQQLYSSLKDKLSQQMQSAQAVALTSDIWTSPTNESYLSTTAHFIDNYWNLQRRVLACLPVDGRHTADNICTWLQETVEDFHLESNKIVALVHDNGSNIVAAAQKLEEIFGSQFSSVRCTAHTLQLVIHAALHCNDVIKDAVTAARHVVEYFKRSELATSSLHKIQTQMSLPEHQLVMEVSTRWNSTLYMIERLVEQRWPVSLVIQQRKSDSKNPKSSLTDDQWDVLSHLIRLLKPFEVATEFVSGDEYVTASAVPSLISGLCEKMEQNDDDPSYVKEFKTVALKQLHDRWPLCVSDMTRHNRRMCNVILKSSAVDPQYKMRNIDLMVKHMIQGMIMKSH